MSEQFKHVPIWHDRFEKVDPRKFLKGGKLSIIEDKIWHLQEEIKKLKHEIYEFQENCKHEFYFSCSGTYDDYYTCIHCGYECEV